MTIAAISSAVGEAGIGIVRMSGKNSLCILEKLFNRKNKGKPYSMENRKLTYGQGLLTSQAVDLLKIYHA